MARASLIATRRTWLVLAGATVVGVLLRFCLLGHQSFAYEEAFTAAIAGENSLGDLWNRVEMTESTPPLFYLATWAWASVVDSTSESALRAVTAFFSAVSIPVSFFAARRFVGERAALATAVLCATSPLLVFYALYARTYSLLLLVSLLSIWAFGNLLEGPSRKRWILWALAGAACLWTHYFAAFLLVAEVAFLFWRRPELRRPTLVWGALTATSALPLIPLFSGQKGEAVRTGWISASPLTDRVELAVRELAMGPNVPEAVLEAGGLLLAAGALAVGVFLALRSERRAEPLLVLLLIAAGIPFMLELTGIDKHFLLRNVLMVWLPVAALASLALVRWRMVPLLAYAALSVFTVLAIQGDWRYQNSDWRGMSKRLEPRAEGDPLIVYPDTNSKIGALYLDRADPGIPVATDDVWVIVEPERQNDRELLPVREPVPPGLLQPQFRLADRVDYRGFQLLRYSAKEEYGIDPIRIRRYQVRGFPPTLLVPGPPGS